MNETERSKPISPHLQTESNTEYAVVAREDLWAIEKNLPGYNQHIVQLLSAHAQPHQAALDFGAGIGTLAQLWSRLKGKHPDCLEIDAVSREI